MLSIDGIRVGYGHHVAVSDTSLTVGAGETVGLVGPNGAGKTTMLSAVAGLLSPSEGTIRFGDESIIGRPPDAIARLGVSLVPEGRRIFAEMTVRENLELGLMANTLGVEPEAEFERIFARLPVLKRLFNTTAGNLSGGEQQQLAIARALLGRPRVLLLDEPSLGLAPQVVNAMFDILHELRDGGATMLLVEQNVRRTIEFCDRTYIMRAGRVELCGTRDELEGNDAVAQAYLGS